jgi:hypothetical protein
MVVTRHLRRAVSIHGCHFDEPDVDTVLTLRDSASPQQHPGIMLICGHSEPNQAKPASHKHAIAWAPRRSHILPSVASAQALG